MAISENVVTWYEGKWHRGNAPIIGAADQAAWLGSTVFDASRQFERVRPDLILNCKRIVASAEVLGMVSPVTPDTVFGLIEEGCKMFDADAVLYLRPMMWAKESGAGIIDLDPNSTGFSICIEELPMPGIENFTLTVSDYRRPRPDMAMTMAKAGSLYAHNGRIMADARRRGFSNALSLDIDDHVAETASTNVFMVRDGEVLTPVPNGTFLNGLNRQRVIKLLRADGIKVTETSLTVEDFENADEIFCTGNIGKVVPVAKFQDRVMPDCPISLHTRSLYWDFAHSRYAQQDVA